MHRHTDRQRSIISNQTEIDLGYYPSTKAGQVQLRSLKIASLKKNHFLLEEEVRRLFEPLVGRITSELRAGTNLYRARVGFVTRGFPLMGWLEERHYRPFEGAQLGAPPPPVVGAGRMNRGGVSFLYLATEADTAIAEIRPHPGHFCSVGSFVANVDLTICDLSSLEVTDFASSDEQLNEFLLLRTVDDAFSVPVVPENRAEYHFPQLLADVIRHLKFDGIGYRSSVGTGTNYVFFDPGTFMYVPNSASVVMIDSLEYKTTTMRAMDPSENYLKRSDGTFV